MTVEEGAKASVDCNNTDSNNNDSNNKPVAMNSIKPYYKNYKKDLDSAIKSRVLLLIGLYFQSYELGAYMVRSISRVH